MLPAWDTPREALTTAALLRLPPSLSRAHKLRRVEETLEVLELGACADTLIGDAAQGARGLSGGQRRRVTSAWLGGGMHAGTAGSGRCTALRIGCVCCPGCCQPSCRILSSINYRALFSNMGVKH